MKITCEKCGTVFETQGCPICKKGIMEYHPHLLIDNEYRCDWCGFSTYADTSNVPNDYNCPTCKYDNRPSIGKKIKKWWNSI